ncbi:hypothetical protein GGU10DRAFT_332878 [Lentinula aff. detonsa]|uniref:DUF6533 domain-containing protein n=1 Tax=Lentinula aff. detonsa TaxID=2804958 RepID=A0AA38KGE2_9AGAR|nr:hypothetical protein GGU10DRAFT_332878 [Lentinula aff. detonsa]
MSELSASDIQIQVNWDHYVELIEFVLSVILIYDYLLTFDIEIERFWKRETKRFASILFFINRYMTLLGNIPIVLLFFWPEPGRGALDLFAQILIFLVQFNISVLFVLRMYAIYSSSRRIVAFLSVVLTAMVVNNVVQLYLADRTGLAAVDPPSAVAQIGSIPSFSNAQGLHLAYLWIGIFAFDFCVFSLTLWKTYYMYKDGYISGGIGTVVMRDGLMYFGIITLANLGNILVFAFGPEFTKGLLPVFSSIISSVIMSRLMLNLREENLNETQLSGLLFANNSENDP